MKLSKSALAEVEAQLSQLTAELERTKSQRELVRERDRKLLETSNEIEGKIAALQAIQKYAAEYDAAQLEALAALKDTEDAVEARKGDEDADAATE